MSFACEIQKSMLKLNTLFECLNNIIDYENLFEPYFGYNFYKLNKILTRLLIICLIFFF